ncbi:MAG: ABC transporter ATP-binding protein [Pseudomonadota bacterium]
MTAIEVNHLTKEYRLGALAGLKDNLLNTAARLRGREVQRRALFKALDDVSFSVDKGEVLGIIGHNGAGKSTLLKVLARITTATSGSIKVDGRIAPLIEVGAGFIPDFTGRENVYLNGAIMGLSKKEIDTKFDEIVAFAEMEEFIDTPVKRYSSGMQVKLAFSVATSIESEILIVDEVLAVGDLAFQRKCFDRMEELIKSQGRTVLIVSHNIRQVIRMCNRVIMMDGGKVASDGDPLQVTELYYNQSNQRIQQNQHEATAENARIQSSGEVELLEINVLDGNENITEEIVSGDSLGISVKLLCHRPLEKPEIVVGTHTTDFIYLSAGSTAVLDDRPDFTAGTHVVKYRVPSFPMVAGAYCVRVSIFDSNGRLVLSGETLKTFTVVPLPGEAKHPPLRTLHLPAAWDINNVE